MVIWKIKLKVVRTWQKEREVKTPYFTDYEYIFKVLSVVFKTFSLYLNNVLQDINLREYFAVNRSCRTKSKKNCSDFDFEEDIFGAYTHHSLSVGGLQPFNFRKWREMKHNFERHKILLLMISYLLDFTGDCDNVFRNFTLCFRLFSEKVNCRIFFLNFSD